jgi:hypothetical protein
VVVSIPAAILGVVLYRLLSRVTGSDSTALVITMGYALATSAFPYAGALYSHQLVAALVFGTFALLWKQREPGLPRLLVAGLLMGLALISEYPVALIVGGLGLYALANTRKLISAIHIGLGAIPPLVVMAVHNLLIFGTPLPVGYSYSTLWQSEHQSGFYSLSVPTFEAFWGITFGVYRGLFFISPFLLVGFFGLLVMARRRDLRPETVLVAWSVLSFLAFNSTSVMWSGGFGVGPRYLVPMLPFLALATGVAAAHWRRHRALHILVAALLAWSFVVTWSLTIGGQAFPDFTPNPLVNLAIPALAEGNIARNLGTLLGLRGWWSLLLLAVLVVLLAPTSVRMPAMLGARFGRSGPAGADEAPASAEGRPAAIGL